MIQYPPQLPPPLQEGYALNTVDPMMRTQMVTGRARQRTKFSYVPTYVQASFIFEEAEAAFFEAWYARTINNGVLWFECTLKTPIGFKLYEARFTKIYDGPDLVQVNRWKYSAMLELRERPLMDPYWEQFPEYWFNKDIIDLAVNREWPLSRYQINMDAFDYGVNQEWPQP